MKNKKSKQISNLILIILIFVSTLTIISTNYYFSQKTTQNITKELRQQEYNKIGGKENYLILQEIQKREINGYLEKLKQEKPELIKEIKDSLKEEEKKEQSKINYKILDQIVIKKLKENTDMKGNTGALISIIKFSDPECSHCIKQNKKDIPNKLLKEYPEKINYIFKTTKGTDLEQAKKLGLTLIPSSLIINNNTGKFTILSEEQEIEAFEKIIKELIK